MEVKYQRHNAGQSEFDHYQEHHLREEWFVADNYELRQNYFVSKGKSNRQRGDTEKVSRHLSSSQQIGTKSLSMY